MKNKQKFNLLKGAPPEKLHGPSILWLKMTRTCKNYRKSAFVLRQIAAPTKKLYHKHRWGQNYFTEWEKNFLVNFFSNIKFPPGGATIKILIKMKSTWLKVFNKNCKIFFRQHFFPKKSDGATNIKYIFSDSLSQELFSKNMKIWRWS